jgi:hypothetical protein
MPKKGGIITLFCKLKGNLILDFFGFARENRARGACLPAPGGTLKKLKYISRASLSSLCSR